eukprot:XP_024442699.1 receptor-like protein EIX1 [Populus trichocarpa]
MLLIKHDRSFHHLYVLIVLLLLMKLAPGFISGVKGATFGCIERERQALLKFKEDLIDDFGLLSTWGSEEEKRDCCKWRGVRCNNRTGHVTHLDLHQENYINGYLTDAFTNMTSFRTLDLSFNQLQGDLSTFGRMCSLKVLHMSGNNLTGELSQLFQDSHGCVESSLEILQLDGNQLHGSVPDITRFTSMTELDLSRNQLNGSLPKRFSQRSEIVILYLNDNQLTGSLADVTMLSSLREFVIANNRLDGNVSESIGSLYQLEQLDVGRNSLQGVMSEAHFSNLSKLTVLDLTDNSLALKFESNWAPTFQLDRIFLSSCNLGPHFPQWLRNQNNFMELDISGSRISDTVPNWFWNLSNSKLQLLNLSHNKMSGILPDFSSKYSILRNMDLSFNQFEGPLPLFSSDTISTLFLSNNKFSGSASFLCNIGRNISVLDLSNNLLTGWIPDCSMNFTRLNILNFASNNFSGNQLSGVIPITMADLNFLAFLNLSNNHLSGRIPSSTQLQGFNASQFTGNLALCGKPLLQRCPGDETNQSPPANDDNRGKEVVADEFMKWFCTAMGIGFSVFFWGVSGALLLKRSWRHAYFRFLDESWDWLYVKVAVRKARLQRAFQWLHEHGLA